MIERKYRYTYCDATYSFFLGLEKHSGNTPHFLLLLHKDFEVLKNNNLIIIFYIVNIGLRSWCKTSLLKSRERNVNVKF